MNKYEQDQIYNELLAQKEISKTDKDFLPLRTLFCFDRKNISILKYVTYIMDKPQFPLIYRASLVAQMVKNLLTVQETGFVPWVGKISWRKEWQPTLVILPGEFHVQRSLVGYRPWVLKESDKHFWLP